MQKAKASLPNIKVIQWIWSKNKDLEHPIKLRVGYERERRYYPVTHNGEKLFLSESDWDTIQDRKVKVRGEKKAIRESIDLATSEALEVKNRIIRRKPFTFDGFETEYINQESKKGFLRLFQDHLAELLEEKRIGTYKGYTNAFQAFNEFRGGTRPVNGSRNQKGFKHGKDLSALDITPSLLKKFEAHLKNRGAGRNTIAIYMRTLKVIFNLAISKTPELAQSYPFATKQNDRNRYKIKTGAGRKGEALSVDQIQTLMDIKTEPGLPEHEALNLFLFSFHCQGMNMRDIALLKYQNIEGETIRYIREKTRETETIETPIEIPLTDSIRKIISSIGNPDKRPSAYVFQILIPRMSAMEIDSTIRQKIKVVNRLLRGLCESNDLPEITTYWARHSYANLLKESGESIDMIRELLGHSDVKTTESYLKRFDIDRKRKANRKIESLFKSA